MEKRWVIAAAAGVLCGAAAGQTGLSITDTVTAVSEPMASFSVPSTEGAATQALTAEEGASLHPRGLTLDFKASTPAQVSEALSKITGVDTWSAAGGPFTLQVADAPLWEVFLQLNKQGDVTIEDEQARQVRQFGGKRMMGAGTVIKTGVRSGDFLAVVSQLNYARSADLQGDAKPQAGLSIAFGVVPDPRLKVVAWQRPDLRKVVDDQGHVLYSSEGARNGFSPVYNPQQTSVYSSASLQADAGGTKIVSATGNARAVLGIGEVKVEIADLLKQDKTPIVLGDQQVEVPNCKFIGNTLTMDLRQSRRAGAPATGEELLVPIMMTIEDGKGNRLYQGSGGISGSWGGSYVGPIKGTFIVPAKMRVVDVPFEFKDLPLPK